MPVTQLRLTEADPDLKVSPEALLERLFQPGITIVELAREFHCTPDNIRETLDDSRTAHLIELQTQLAAIQVKLIAIQAAPQAMRKCVQLIDESPKPEVSRRCTTTVFHVAGIATTTKAAEPQAVPLPDPEADRKLQCGYTPEEAKEIWAKQAAALDLERGGFNIGTIPPDQRFTYAKILRDVKNADPRIFQILEFIHSPRHLESLLQHGDPYYLEQLDVQRAIDAENNPSAASPNPAPTPTNPPRRT